MSWGGEGRFCVSCVCVWESWGDGGGEGEGAVRWGGSVLCELCVWEGWGYGGW